MKRTGFRILLLIFTVAVLAAGNTTAASAWDQSPAYKTHQTINQLALNKFFNDYRNSPKYADSPIDTARSFGGPEALDPAMLEGNHKVQFGLMKFEDWVKHGGYSADEPNLWASVRHFYDPVSMDPQLTDHDAGHGLIYQAVSARDWAFRDDTNPFGWKKALEYYKKSMEIPDDDKNTVVPGTDFRDPGISAETPAAERSIYLGKAFRSLGETMHMIGDMTLPCHTRNDSHPTFDVDPSETAVNSSTVWIVSDYPVEPGIAARIDAAPDAQAMYVEIALFTNANFYSDDTIYDKASGVEPRNGETPYPSPQFKDLIPLYSLNHPRVATGDPVMYGKYFNKILIPMIQEGYSHFLHHQLDPADWVYKWQIPMSFALEQAKIQIPIALKANSKLVDLFFPTMELTMQIKKSQSSEPDNPGYQEFEATGRMAHLIEKDAEWRLQDLESIKYSGPAELWGVKAGRLSENIQFEQGTLKKRLILYSGTPRNATVEQYVDKFQVQDGDSFYMVIKAGGRIFKSKSTGIATCGITIQPETLEATVGKPYIFTARPSTTPKTPTYTWNVDGREVQSGPGSTLSVTFKQEGTSTVQVTLRDGESECNAAARVTVRPSVQPSPQPPSPSPAPQPQKYTVTNLTTNISPSSYKGRCPASSLKVTGVITVNGPCTVTYIEETSLGSAKIERSIDFSQAGSKTINYGYLWPSVSGTYWYRIHVLTPNDMNSEASVSVNCCDPAIENVSYTGKWDVSGYSFGGYPSYMYLTQSGDQVTGTYDYQHGKIKGTVHCGEFSGTWSEEPTYGPPHDSGTMKFTLSKDSAGNDVFNGSWEYANPATEGRGGLIGGTRVP